MQEATVFKIDADARRGYSYLPDVVDTWRSHRKEVMKRKRWRGDCDDLTSTVLDMLGHSGLPLYQRYRLCVSSVKGPTVDHMVGLVVLSNDVHLVVGDTFRRCYPLAQMAHRGLSYQRMDHAKTGQWHLGVPFDGR